MPYVFVSEATRQMYKDEIIKEVEKIDTSVEKYLILAIIKQESDFHQFAIRYEPHLKEASWYLKCLKKNDITNNLSYCSAGPMQILLGIARSQGFSGSFEELMNITNNIYQGTKLLETLSIQYKEIKDVIAGYNGGPTAINSKKNDIYLNQEYVTNVYLNYKSLGGKQ